VGRLHTISAVVALALAASGPPPAAAGPRALWATVNVCDTAGHPDAIGIRGSMPGSGGRFVRMRMRFRLQYRVSSGRWQALRSGGDSGWVAVGSGRVRAGQAGQTFTLTPPGAGRAYVLRGLVSFQWRRGRHVVARARRVTTAGHGATRGADPAGFSAATCRIA
jgi:hypothetical protein